MPDRPDRPDRHREKPLSLRLGAERQPVEDAAVRAGVPVRQWILSAAREKLARDEQERAEGESMSETSESASLPGDADPREGERVRHKLTGQQGTVYEYWPGSGTVCVAYDDGTTARHALAASFDLADAESAPRTGTWAQDVSDGSPTIRAGSVITVTDPG